MKKNAENKTLVFRLIIDFPNIFRITYTKIVKLDIAKINFIVGKSILG